jgi:hypothetical protein
LVRITCHLSPSHRRTSQIPPISLCVCMCIPLSLLGNGTLRRFRSNMRMVGLAVFYVVRVLSKEIMRVILPSISRFGVLLNDDFSREYIRTVGWYNEWWRANWKGFVRKRSWPKRSKTPTFIWWTEENRK